MKKVVILVATSVGLICFSWWASTSWVAFSLRNVPPERHAFVLDVTSIREEAWILGSGAIALAIVLLVAAAISYAYEIKRNR
jgi:hypothetical protein